jgi:type I restriction enzyme R subunit
MAAKEFDLLILRTQLAVLRSDRRLPRLRERIEATCALLEELGNVPAVAAQMPLILEMQTNDYWQDITAPILELARRRLRGLLKLIGWKKRPIIYSDFTDDIGDGQEIEFAGLPVGTDMAKFRLKAQYFLKEHGDHIAIRKLRKNEPLTPTDLAELEKMFVSAGVADAATLGMVQADGGLGVFVRSLIGLDREAAKKAFDAFLSDKSLSGNQIEFLNMVIDHLTHRGVMEPGLLYESPFTDLNPLGVDGVFGEAKAAQIVSILEEINRKAAA